MTTGSGGARSFSEVVSKDTRDEFVEFVSARLDRSMTVKAPSCLACWFAVSEGMLFAAGLGSEVLIRAVLGCLD